MTGTRHGAPADPPSGRRPLEAPPAMLVSPVQPLSCCRTSQGPLIAVSVGRLDTALSVPRSGPTTVVVQAER